MPDPGLADLENLLAGGGPPAGASAEAVDIGRKFGHAVFSTAAEAWGAFLGKRLVYEEGETSCHRPADALANIPPQVIVTRFQWRGEQASEYYMIMPALFVKDLVAHFLALAAGREAEPAAQRLDDEAMEAYRELVNTLAGQATVALANEFGEGAALSQVESRLVDFATSPPALEFGRHERICHACRLTVEGSVPMPCLLLLPPAAAATPAAAAEKRPVADVEASAEPPSSTVEILKKIAVPLVVVLASKYERMENILAWRPGAIIEFRKRSNELLDVCVNKIKIAEGEVVITNGHFGIQLRKMVDPRQAFVRFH